MAQRVNYPPMTLQVTGSTSLEQRQRHYTPNQATPSIRIKVPQIKRSRATERMEPFGVAVATSPMVVAPTSSGEKENEGESVGFQDKDPTQDQQRSARPVFELGELESRAFALARADTKVVRAGAPLRGVIVISESAGSQVGFDSGLIFERWRWG